MDDLTKSIDDMIKKDASKKKANEDNIITEEGYYIVSSISGNILYGPYEDEEQAEENRPQGDYKVVHRRVSTPEEIEDLKTSSKKKASKKEANYQPYEGGSGPSDDLVKSNNEYIAKELAKIGLTVDVLESGEEVKVKDSTGQSYVVSFDRWGYVVEDTDLDQVGPDEILSFFKEKASKKTADDVNSIKVGDDVVTPEGHGKVVKRDLSGEAGNSDEISVRLESGQEAVFSVDTDNIKVRGAEATPLQKDDEVMTPDGRGFIVEFDPEHKGQFKTLDILVRLEDGSERPYNIEYDEITKESSEHGVHPGDEGRDASEIYRDPNLKKICPLGPDDNMMAMASNLGNIVNASSVRVEPTLKSDTEIYLTLPSTADVELAKLATAEEGFQSIGLFKDVKGNNVLTVLVDSLEKVASRKKAQTTYEVEGGNVLNENSNLLDVSISKDMTKHYDVRSTNEFLARFVKRMQSLLEEDAQKHFSDKKLILEDDQTEFFPKIKTNSVEFEVYFKKDRSAVSEVEGAEEKPKTISAPDAVEIIETIAEEFEAEYNPNYSGKGMYGKSCPGVITDVPEEVTRVALEKGLSQPRTDALGLRTIVYWPSVDTSITASLNKKTAADGLSDAYKEREDKSEEDYIQEIRNYLTDVLHYSGGRADAVMSDSDAVDEGMYINRKPSSIAKEIDRYFRPKKKAALLESNAKIVKDIYDAYYQGIEDLIESDATNLEGDASALMTEWTNGEIAEKAFERGLEENTAEFVNFFNEILEEFSVLIGEPKMIEKLKKSFDEGAMGTTASIEKKADELDDMENWPNDDKRWEEVWLEQLNEQGEVKAYSIYGDVVGIKGKEVMSMGKVVDTLDTREKIKALYDEMIEDEFGSPEQMNKMLEDEFGSKKGSSDGLSDAYKEREDKSEEDYLQEIRNYLTDVLHYSGGRADAVMSDSDAVDEGMYINRKPSSIAKEIDRHFRPKKKAADEVSENEPKTETEPAKPSATTDEMYQHRVELAREMDRINDSIAKLKTRMTVKIQPLIDQVGEELPAVTEALEGLEKQTHVLEGWKTWISTYSGRTTIDYKGILKELRPILQEYHGGLIAVLDELEKTHSKVGPSSHTVKDKRMTTKSSFEENFDSIPKEESSVEAGVGEIWERFKSWLKGTFQSLMKPLEVSSEMLDDYLTLVQTNPERFEVKASKKAADGLSDAYKEREDKSEEDYLQEIRNYLTDVLHYSGGRADAVMSDSDAVDEGMYINRKPSSIAKEIDRHFRPKKKASVKEVKAYKLTQTYGTYYVSIEVTPEEQDRWDDILGHLDRDFDNVTFKGDEVKITVDEAISEEDAVNIVKESLKRINVILKEGNIKPEASVKKRSGSRTDFLMDNSTKLKEAVSQLEEMSKNFENLFENISEEEIKRALNNYDTNVESWIVSGLGTPNSSYSVDEIVDFALDNQHKFGTEPYFVLEAIGELYRMAENKGVFKSKEDLQEGNIKPEASVKKRSEVGTFPNTMEQAQKLRMLLNEIEINPSFDLDALEEGVHSLFGADDLLDQVDEDYMNDGMEIVPKNVKDTIKNHVSEILKDEHFRSQLDDEVAAELDAITKTAKFSI